MRDAPFGQLEPAPERDLRTAGDAGKKPPITPSTVTLYYDGEKAGDGKIALTEPMLFTATETAEIGRELGTTVMPDTSSKDTEFTGEIKWVELSAGEDDHSHTIDPDHIVHMLMSKQ